MNTDLKSSGQRPAGVALLITVGRLCFSIATICAFTHLFFEWPAQFLHIAIGLAAAMVLLLLAAFLLRVFRWLWQMPVIGLGLAGLTINGVLFKAYFGREPHHLTAYETRLAAAGFPVFVVCAVLLRLFKTPSGTATARP